VPRKRDYSKGKQQEKQEEIVAASPGATLPPKGGAPQIPEQGWEAKPRDLTNPVIWGQDKEKVVDVDHGEARTRPERGEPIDDAGGKQPEN
jgi:hypothetical protein